MGGDEHPEALHHFVSRQLVRSILTGALKAGQRLSPVKLAAELNVSHIPVREALAALEASGHVVRKPRRGFFVAELSLAYIEDVYHWRQVLEDEAHRLAIPRLVRSDFTRMRKLDGDIAKADLYSARHLDLNRKFHFITFGRVDSENLLRFLGHLWDASTRYQSALATMNMSRAVVSDQHEQLIAAYADGDVELANALMAEHRGVTLDAIRRRVSAPHAHGA